MENQQEPQGAEQLTEPQATEPTAEPIKQEPHGEPAKAQQIDWKAEARKWEKRAKESNAKLQGSSDLEDRLAAVEERAQRREDKVRKNFFCGVRRAEGTRPRREHRGDA